jgi:hypothetical protein
MLSHLTVQQSAQSSFLPSGPGTHPIHGSRWVAMTPGQEGAQLEHSNPEDLGCLQGELQRHLEVFQMSRESVCTVQSKIFPWTLESARDLRHRPQTPF